LIVAVFNLYFVVVRLSPAAGKSIKAAEKGKLRTALDPKNFRISLIGIVAKKNYCGCIFGDWRSLHSRSW